MRKKTEGESHAAGPQLDDSGTVSSEHGVEIAQASWNWQESLSINHPFCSKDINAHPLMPPN